MGDCPLRDDVEFCEKVGVSRKDGDRAASCLRVPNLTEIHSPASLQLPQ